MAAGSLEVSMPSSSTFCAAATVVGAGVADGAGVVVIGGIAAMDVEGTNGLPSEERLVWDACVCKEVDEAPRCRGVYSVVTEGPGCDAKRS